MSECSEYCRKHLLNQSAAKNICDDHLYNGLNGSKMRELLREVLVNCRNKSSVPTSKWHEIKKKIERQLNNAQ